MITDEELQQIPIKVVDFIETHYDLGRTIGRGEFAKVKLARCKVTQQLRLSHPSIVKLIQVLQLPNRIAVVMEYASGGEIFDYVQSKGHLPQMEVRIIMKQLFEENLLRTDDGRIAITDFGFATVLHTSDKILQTACGSPCYAAPELVLDKNGYQGPPADLWSCGVIMYAMSYGFLPFESDLHLDQTSNTIVWTPSNVYQLYQYISTNPLRLPKTPSDGLDERGQDLLLRLLDARPESRINIEQVWSHPWMSTFVTQ